MSLSSAIFVMVCTWVTPLSTVNQCSTNIIKERRVDIFFEGIFQPTHLILILIVVLIIFGPGKLPEVGKAMGKTVSEFRKATSGGFDQEEKKEKTKEESGDSK